MKPRWLLLQRVFRGPRPRRRWSRWIVRPLVFLIGAAILLLLFPPVRRALWTSLFLADFMAGEAPSPYKWLTHEPMVSSDTLYAADGTAVPFDLYRVPGDRPVAGLVFTHGLAHEGRRDHRVQEQSRRLARAGFAVMAPDLLQMKTYRLGFGDVEAVVSCLDYLRRLPGVDPARVGISAPSFGAGPVLIALSRPRVRDQVCFGLIFGGYYDLERTLLYTLTGAYDAEGYQGRVDFSANRHNRWKFLLGNLDLLPASPSRGEYVRFLSAKLENPDLDIRPVLPGFSGEEQRLLEFMDNEEPGRFDSLYASLPATVHAWIDTFSLYHYTPDLRTWLLIVHSDADNKVPFTESLALSRHLPHAPRPFVAVVSLFAHVDLALRWDSFQAVRQKVLPGLRQLWLLADLLLRQRP